MLTVALTLSTAIAALPESDVGWVQPDRSELTRVLGVRWTAQIGEPEFLVLHPEQWTAPLISDDHGRVFAAASNGTLETRVLATGELLWRKTKLGSIGAFMGEHQGKLILSAGSTLVALEDQSGEERWRSDISGAVGGRIVISGTTAIVPVRPSTYVAINVEDGTILWRAKRPTPEGITMHGMAPPAVDRARDRVYLGFSDGSLMAVSLSKGDPQWTVPLGKPGQAFADVDTEPMLVDNGTALIAASYSGGLHRIEAQSGRVEWKHEDLDRLTSLALASSSADLIVASHGDGQVLGVTIDKGKVRWRYRMKRRSPTDPIALGRGLVLVGGTHGAAAVLDTQTGKPVQLIALGAGASATPSWRDPDLAFFSNRGHLVVFRFGDGGGVSP
jgi:outer membrane protein assembly factor BamB